ncbi:MAG: hypothetical protein BWY63_00279 [Chloroflexi bacterium ADurb.Bin360]|nr:MAG: hypothetical protein BWY63_00279 [Chloroflexi bacterium ADurb.Bin360]
MVCCKGNISRRRRLLVDRNRGHSILIRSPYTLRQCDVHSNVLAVGAHNVENVAVPLAQHGLFAGDEAPHRERLAFLLCRNPRTLFTLVNCAHGHIHIPQAHQHFHFLFVLPLRIYRLGQLFLCLYCALALGILRFLPAHNFSKLLNFAVSLVVLLGTLFQPRLHKIRTIAALFHLRLHRFIILPRLRHYLVHRGLLFRRQRSPVVRSYSLHVPIIILQPERCVLEERLSLVVILCYFVHLVRNAAHSPKRSPKLQLSLTSRPPQLVRKQRRAYHPAVLPNVQRPCKPPVGSMHNVHIEPPHSLDRQPHAAKVPQLLVQLFSRVRDCL